MICCRAARTVSWPRYTANNEPTGSCRLAGIADSAPGPERLPAGAIGRGRGAGAGAAVAGNPATGGNLSAAPADHESGPLPDGGGGQPQCRPGGAGPD